MNENSDPPRGGKKQPKPSASDRFKALLIVLVFIAIAYIASDICIRVMSGGEQSLTAIIIDKFNDWVREMKELFGNADFLIE